MPLTRPQVTRLAAVSQCFSRPVGRTCSPGPHRKSLASTTTRAAPAASPASATATPTARLTRSTRQSANLPTSRQMRRRMPHAILPPRQSSPRSAAHRHTARVPRKLALSTQASGRAQHLLLQQHVVCTSRSSCLCMLTALSLVFCPICNLHAQLCTPLHSVSPTVP